jgi:glutamate synthase (ferredoxin)
MAGRCGGVRMLLPPAVTGISASVPALSQRTARSRGMDRLRLRSATVSVVVGAALDRNGLRPCRFAITSDGLVVAGSEAGLVDLDPETVIESGRLGPGEMLVVDMAKHKVYHNEERCWIVRRGRRPTRSWLRLAAFEPMAEAQLPMQLSKSAGYSADLAIHREDVKMILQPMAARARMPCGRWATIRRWRFWRARRGRCTRSSGSGLRR